MKPPCSAEGCARSAEKRGMCDTHYQRLRRAGLLAARTVEERFWSKVNKNGPAPERRPDLGPCWLWTAGTDSSGYGGFYPSPGCRVGAHRWSYEQAHGPIPEGLEADHVCFVPAYVNPTHLEAVTHEENTRRARRIADARARTHCPAGHALTDDNTRPGRDGGAVRCRTCRLAEQRQRARGAAA